MNRSIEINRGEVALSRAQLTVKTVLCPVILQAWPAGQVPLAGSGRLPDHPTDSVLVIFRVVKKASGPAEPETADTTPKGFFLVLLLFFSGANLDPG